MQLPKKKSNKGYTLVELLIVIILIGILSAFGFNTFSNAQKRAKDAKRKNDIKQYQTALETYASANNSLYPSWTLDGGVNLSGTGNLCSSLSGSPKYLASCPTDENTSNNYKYNSDGTDDGTATALNWALWANLEAEEKYWVVCSNGRSAEVTASSFTVPTSGSCPI